MSNAAVLAGDSRSSDGAAGCEPVDAVFNAVITPHHALDGRAFTLTLCAVFAVAVTFQLCFAAAGLWVAGVFMLGNGLFLIAALIACRRDRNRAERVLVADGGVSVERFDGRRQITHHGTFPLFGLSVEHVVDPDYGCQAIRLRHRAAALEIARDLAPAERASFLSALLGAIHAQGGRPNLRRITTAKLFETPPELGR